MLNNENTNEHSIEDVAASLLINPNEKEEKTAPKLSQEETVDETQDSVESDQELSEETASEESAEESAESEEAQDEEDLDPDEFEIEVTVDGVEKKVKLKELKANYSGNGAIEKRLQEASEIRNAAMEQGKRLYTALQEEAVRLAKLDEIVKNLAEPEINWEELKRTNLPKYLLERDRQREAEIRRTRIQEEQARVKAEQEKLEELARQQYTANEAKQLVAKIPEFGDPVKAQETYAKLAKAASIYGYAAEEVGSVLDHRAMLVLNDAMKYQELIKNKTTAQKKTAPATALLRPSASKANKPVNQAKKLQQALIKRARSTGKAEDVAATLLIRKK